MILHKGLKDSVNKGPRRERKDQEGGRKNTGRRRRKGRGGGGGKEGGGRGPRPVMAMCWPGPGAMGGAGGGQRSDSPGLEGSLTSRDQPAACPAGVQTAEQGAKVLILDLLHTC